MYWASPYSSEYGLIVFANTAGSGSRLARKSHLREKTPPHISFVRWSFFAVLTQGAACATGGGRRKKLFFSRLIDAIGIIHLFKPCCILFHAFTLLFYLTFMVIITSLKVATCLNASVIISVTKHVKNAFY